MTEGRQFRRVKKDLREENYKLREENDKIENEIEAMNARIERLDMDKKKNKIVIRKGPLETKATNLWRRKWKVS